MAKLDFYIEGQKALSRNLRLLADGVTDMKGAFANIGKIIESSAKTNFDQQGSEGGGAWKQLRPSTIKARSERRGYYKNPGLGGPTGPILTWTGKMRNSFTRDVSKDSVMVTNSDKKFAFHQSTLRGNPRLPRRLILELKQADKASAVSEIGKEINRQIGNFGRQI